MTMQPQTKYYLLHASIHLSIHPSIQHYHACSQVYYIVLSFPIAPSSISSSSEDSDTGSYTTATTAIGAIFSPRNLPYTGDEGSTATPYCTGDETSRPSSLRSLESLREEEEGEEEPCEGEGVEASSTIPQRPDVPCHVTIIKRHTPPVLSTMPKSWEFNPADSKEYSYHYYTLHN